MTKKIDKTKYGVALFELNQRLFSQRYPYQDDVLHKICLHLIVGQLPNLLQRRFNIDGSKLDFRFHSTIFAPSGTNKGSIFNYAEELCSKMDMRLNQMGDFTDTALVGMPNQKMRKDKETGDEYMVDASTYGELHSSKFNNILGWSEGTDVFDIKKANYNKNTLNILQKCMNPIGSSDNVVSKATGLGVISYNTCCSLFLTTYKPHTLTSEVIGTGFLQRQVVAIHEPSLAESRQTGKNATRGLTRPPKTRESVDLLAHRLMEINDFIGKMDDVYVPDEIQEKIEYVQDGFYEQISDANILVKDKLGEFVRRWSVNILYTIMFHHALIRMDNKVNEHDVLYAKDFLLPIWIEFAAFLENALLNDNKELDYIKNQMREIIISYRYLCEQYNSDTVPEIALVSKISLDWGKSIKATKQIVAGMIGDVFEVKIVRQHEELFAEGDTEGLGRQRLLKLKDGIIRLVI